MINVDMFYWWEVSNAVYATGNLNFIRFVVVTFCTMHLKQTLYKRSNFMWIWAKH